MELYAALFIAFVGLSYAQSDPPLEVKFRNSGARHVSTGDRLNFVCNINRNLMYVLTNVVEIIRKSALDDSEVILTQGAKRQEAEPAFYNVSVIPGENTISVEFIIVKVRDLDEGSLICRARPFDEKPDSEKGEDN
uniref:Immunoglobulin V-set domain-containing protein n=1 Tax=Arion vulgaris TaxID=1028688 RepID=A0A0B7A7I6_9EUPU